MTKTTARVRGPAVGLTGPQDKALSLLGPSAGLLVDPGAPFEIKALGGILVVGEAPDTDGQTKPILDGPATRRMDWLLTGQTERRGAWQEAAAMVTLTAGTDTASAAQQLRRALRPPVEIVLLGRRCAAVFGMSAVPYFRPSTTLLGRIGAWTAPVWVVPHPSGAAHWWGEMTNAHVARQFFRELVERASKGVGPC